MIAAGVTDRPSTPCVYIVVSCVSAQKAHDQRWKPTRTEAAVRLEENERGDETIVLSSRDKRWAKSPTRKEKGGECVRVRVYA